jgi:peptidoglycan/LPS O-acetylase OafA/YrhL
MRLVSANFGGTLARAPARPADINRLRYIPEIDGLRACAVLSVMLCHLNKALMPGGFVGVDVFFVISGYVVTASLSRDASRPLFTMMAQFYARRFLRIIPALIVCLLVTLILTSMFIPNSWLSSTIKNTALSAFFGASNFPLLAADSYFSPRPEFNPFTHTWSLAIEEQFYVILPIMFYLWAKPGNLGRVGRIIFRYGVPGLCIASFTCFALNNTGDQKFNFYMLPGRFWELGIGAVLFQLQMAGKADFIAARQKTLLLITGTLMVGVAAIFADPNAFPFPWSIPAALGSLIFIASVSATSGGPTTAPILAKAFRCRPMIFIGRISYSLYLWHWPIYTLFRWTVGLNGILLEATAFGLSFLLAYLSYAIVERPIRRGKWVLERPKMLVVVTALAVSVVVLRIARELVLGRVSWRVTALQVLFLCLLVLTYLCCLFAARPRALRDWIVAQPGVIVVVAGFSAILGGWFAANEIVRTDQLSLSVVTTHKSDWYPEQWSTLATEPNCHLKEEISGSDDIVVVDSIENVCVDQRQPPPRLFVVGDSHALAYRGLLIHLVSHRNINVIIYSHTNCSFANLQTPTPPPCRDFVAASLASVIANGQPNDIVFLAALRMVRLGNEWGNFKKEDIQFQIFSPDAVTERGLAHAEAIGLIGTLFEAHLHVVIEAPKPLFRSPPFRCSDWFNARNPDCVEGVAINREELLRNRRPILDSVIALRERYPDLIVWDPFPILCPNETCYAVTPAGPLFFDGDHLSGFGNRVLYPYLASLLDETWGTARH